ncbi:MAG: Eco57I restriction-modification methylase domain-containing protein, partial [Tannerella sp.]|nr:Eco57I restriction-modification methylase domain-containing protein [Tannerella sp.]
MEKKAIESVIKAFTQGDLTSNALNLFAALGYNTSRKSHLLEKTFNSFKTNFPLPDSFNVEKALVVEWKYVDLLFQLSNAEISMQNELWDNKKLDNKIIESYLFIVIELTGKEYTRTRLAQVCREVNKIFPMPVMVLFKYGEYITLSVIDRRINKRQGDKDVLEKVTLIKDISANIPHRAHIEILHSLSLEELQDRYTISNFVELHSAWQKTLDTKELNDRFYNDLYNWYEWAVTLVQFPSGNAKKPHILDKNNKDDEKEIRKNLIRLVTRLIFVWFIKQKRLIPDEIFSVDVLRELLIGFNSQDKTSGNYYNAVIQNLFFATLNREIKERSFAEDVKEQRNEQYMIKFYFRDDKKHTFFKIDPKEFVTKFDVVPFLNGGLFECLDYMEEVENEKNIPICVDGFSREATRRAVVPNILFFGTAKNKKDIECEEGIINIFNRYVFTIEENTPIDQDIALDPELLGKVFENLLATYNPETHESARNDTGSFYTPREIVEYMVDTSLKEYFKQKLSEKNADTVLIEQKLDTLISYNDAEHEFSATEKETLIEAIDKAKILDPACGSGAFPMGVLHKLVYILGKLDPGNELWKERQKQKLDSIQDSVIKKQLQESIDTAFKSGELDYGRKLYLIENCIFGVDIQTIAIQISKLRFFISLIVDQNINSKKANLGILPLPNLETKFIAANTLIGLKKPEGFLRNIELDNLEAALLKIRHDLFSAQTAKDKYDCRKKDKAKRQEIQYELESSGWSNASARQIADWDTYNQNKSTEWFDAEWMFGVSTGFDIVIGNPPYVQLQSNHGELADIYKNSGYESFSRSGDIYQLFYECGYNQLRGNGHLCFITSNKWMRAAYGEKTRTFFANKANAKILIDFAGQRVFESATVDVN